MTWLGTKKPDHHGPLQPASARLTQNSAFVEIYKLHLVTPGLK